MNIPAPAGWGSGVLLLTPEDHRAKHCRNAVIATWAIATIFTLGLATPFLAYHAFKEHCIRHLNRKYFQDLPYAKCISLLENSKVQYKGKEIKLPEKMVKDERTGQEKKALDKELTCMEVLATTVGAIATMILVAAIILVTVVLGVAV